MHYRMPRSSYIRSLLLTCYLPAFSEPVPCVKFASRFLAAFRSTSAGVEPLPEPEALAGVLSLAAERLLACLPEREELSRSPEAMPVSSCAGVSAATGIAASVPSFMLVAVAGAAFSLAVFASQSLLRQDVANMPRLQAMIQIFKAFIN